jgi:hypothetical protein
MPSVLDNDQWSRVERLVQELRAIERWDVDYRRNRYPEAYEMLAFGARRRRRAEILSQLMTLILRLDIYAKGGDRVRPGKLGRRTEGPFVSGAQG